VEAPETQQLREGYLTKLGIAEPEAGSLQHGKRRRCGKYEPTTCKPNAWEVDLATSQVGKPQPDEKAFYGGGTPASLTEVFFGAWAWPLRTATGWPPW
jgi:hypothetical protein